MRASVVVSCNRLNDDCFSNVGYENARVVRFFNNFEIHDD